jgi:hypothetical protein
MMMLMDSNQVLSTPQACLWQQIAQQTAKKE